MIEKLGFNYKKAREISDFISKHGSKKTIGTITWSVVDNNGNYYDYVSKLNKVSENAFSYFYAGRDTNDDYYYLYFDINGFCLTNNNISLHIEKKTDYPIYDIIYNKKNFTAYLKLNDGKEYLGVCLNKDTNPFLVKMDVDKWLNIEDCEEISNKNKENLYDILYKKNIGYDIVSHKVFTLEKVLKPNEWYVQSDIIFQNKKEFHHDMRQASSIQYITLYMNSHPHTIYNNSSMGLPKYMGLRKTTTEEIEHVNNIMNEKHASK